MPTAQMPSRSRTNLADLGIMTALQSYGGIAICLLHRRISLPYAMTQ